MFENDYDYELKMVKWHCKYDGWRIIDKENNAYISFADGNGFLHSLWFDNGRLVHEI